MELVLRHVSTDLLFLLHGTGQGSPNCSRGIRGGVLHQGAGALAATQAAAKTLGRLQPQHHHGGMPRRRCRAGTGCFTPARGPSWLTQAINPSLVPSPRLRWLLYRSPAANWRLPLKTMKPAALRTDRRAKSAASVSVTHPLTERCGSCVARVCTRLHFQSRGRRKAAAGCLAEAADRSSPEVLGRL